MILGIDNEIALLQRCIKSTGKLSENKGISITTPDNRCKNVVMDTDA